jgi:hypothetical protein
MACETAIRYVHRFVRSGQASSSARERSSVAHQLGRAIGGSPSRARIGIGANPSSERITSVLEDVERREVQRLRPTLARWDAILANL